MMIFQDKDPSCIHLYTKPAGLCYWCKVEDDWPHGLIWPQCSRPDLSTHHYSLKDAFWSFWHMYNSYSKAPPPLHFSVYPIGFYLKEYSQSIAIFFSFERYFLNLYFFTLKKIFKVYHIQSLGSSLLIFPKLPLHHLF